ncbi:DUF5953 family protein [Archangium primigenium]|uniref:DUF5953 family protein n=1 Tax=[Archangium] primigenium TaxID=2792470 RepID=UPI001958A14A|nr:DUF5953 family protein [Archangium primigenium]MBM7115899.1 hypothetical protein [Archangium primigenium]
MPPKKEALGVFVYAPVLTRDDRRSIEIVHALERALPGVFLEWTVSSKRQLVTIPQRDVWLVNNRKNGGFQLVCNNDERYPVMMSGGERPAMRGPNGQAILDVHAQVPLDANGIAAAANVLEGIAESARAIWGHASLQGFGSEVAQQIRHSVHGPEYSPRGLPMLKLPWHLPAPAIPYHLGWLNYWSAAAAQAIGFPDPSRDAELLSHARRTPSGGWVVPLTEAPLDLDTPSHLDVLRGC